MRPSALYLGTFALLFAHAACGGKVAVDAPGEGSGGAINPIGAGGATGLGGAWTDTTVGAGGTGAATPATTASSSSSSGSSSTTSSSSSSTTSSSSSSSGAPVSVFCSGGPCMPGNVCCFNPTGPGDHCGQSGQCDPGYVEFSCNGPNDCPGSICCATLDPSTKGLSGIACQTTCDAPDELVVCSQMGPDVCPAGTACHGQQQLGTGPGYRFCVGGP